MVNPLFQPAQFIAACEKVRDLPLQKGNEDSTNFASMTMHLRNMKHSANKELAASPRIEVLFGSEPTVSPPATIISASKRPLPDIAPQQEQIDSTVKESLTLCKGSYFYGSGNPEADIDQFKLPLLYSKSI
jgi:hypothetical protein